MNLFYSCVCFLLFVFVYLLLLLGKLGNLSYHSVQTQDIWPKNYGSISAKRKTLFSSFQPHERL